MSETATGSLPAFTSATMGSPAPACRNCGSALAGPWCFACGQKDVAPDPTLADVVDDAREALDLDGRYARSLALLVARPGELTARYLAGRRAAYVAPFRLYLLCSLLFFLSFEGVRMLSRALQRDVPLPRASVMFGVNRSMVRDPDSPVDSIAGVTGPEWSRRIQRGLRRANRDGSGFWQRVLTAAPRMVFAMVPLYAMLLAVAYRSRRKNFPAHFVFALHGHAFAFLALAAVLYARLFVPSVRVRAILDLVVLAAMSCWFIAAMRRAYGGRLAPAIARGVAVGVAYSILVSTGLLVLFAVEFYLIGAPAR